MSEEIKPRYEFRTFANNFGMVETKLRKFSVCEQIRESAEIYIVSATNNDNNTKIRDSLMDIKTFVKEKNGFQQWNPRMKGSFPMDVSILKNEVFPAFGVEMPDFRRDIYTLEQYLDELIRPHRDLVAVHVFKRRFGFTVHNTIAEIAELWINGAGIQTVCIESTDLDDLTKVKEMLGLGDYDNINYLLGIKRIIGMEPVRL